MLLEFWLWREHDRYDDLCGLGRWNVIPYVHREKCCIAACVLPACVCLELRLPEKSLQRACPNSVSAPSFYSTRQCSYKKTRCHTRFLC
jgi:hypothetical protein